MSSKPNEIRIETPNVDLTLTLESSDDIAIIKAIVEGIEKKWLSTQKDKLLNECK